MARRDATTCPGRHLQSRDVQARADAEITGVGGPGRLATLTEGNPAGAGLGEALIRVGSIERGPDLYRRLPDGEPDGDAREVPAVEIETRAGSRHHRLSAVDA